jgi:hypothetical protein
MVCVVITVMLIRDFDLMGSYYGVRCYNCHADKGF